MDKEQAPNSRSRKEARIWNQIGERWQKPEKQMTCVYFKGVKTVT